MVVHRRVLAFVVLLSATPCSSFLPFFVKSPVVAPTKTLASIIDAKCGIAATTQCLQSSSSEPRRRNKNGAICIFASPFRRGRSSSSSSSLSPLFMGRAAAVRAATKGKTDAKKAKTNAIWGKKIIMAVKQGGSPDPDANRMLKDAITRAKNANVPVDNINRAIKRATEANTADFAESTFEAYGFGGASFVINVLSDNANRASADVKSAIGKNQGKVAEQGSVLFMYDRRGKVEVDGAALDEEELMDAAIEAGCDDMELVVSGDDGDEESSPSSVVYTDPKEVSIMMDAVRSLVGHDEVKGGLAYVSKAPVEVSDEEFEANMKIVDALEELDDVDSVEHNMSN